MDKVAYQIIYRPRDNVKLGAFENVSEFKWVFEIEYLSAERRQEFSETVLIANRSRARKITI